MRALASSIVRPLLTLAAAVVVVAVFAGSIVHAAPRKRSPAGAAPIAVTPFTGLHADEPQAAVLRALGDRGALVKPSDLAKAAPYVIVSGTVAKRDKGLVVEVTVANADAAHGVGQQAGQLAIPLQGRHLTAEQLTELGKQVDELATAALTPAAEPQADATPPPEKPAPPSKQANDTEKVRAPDALATSQPMIIAPPKPPLLPRVPRPRWYPWIEASVGAIVDSRWLKFLPVTPPKYSPGTAGGVHVDLSLYPFAFLHSVVHGVFAGLGGFFTLEKPFWPTTEFLETPHQYATSEFRVEGGAKWRFVVRKWHPRLEISALLGAGLHTYSIAKAIDPTTMARTDAGPPDAAYVYGIFGVQAKANFWHERITPWLSFAYEYFPDDGPLENSDEYGIATTNGIMLRGGLDVYVWKRLRVGGSAFWERIMGSFDNDLTTRRTANRFIDQYYGGVFTVGYDY